MDRHRARLRIPKYLVHASGDQFFLPDNSRFYFKDLEGEKYIRYVPNARHNLGGSDARESLLHLLPVDPREPAAAEVLVDEGGRRIRYASMSRIGRPRSSSGRPPTRRRAISGSTSSALAYTSTTLTEESPGVYLARVPRPVEGFTAFFVELIYDSGFRNPWKFTTEVSVVPDILPFKWEDAKAKYPPPRRP